MKPDISLIDIFMTYIGASRNFPSSRSTGSILIDGLKLWVFCTEAMFDVMVPGGGAVVPAHAIRAPTMTCRSTTVDYVINRTL